MLGSKQSINIAIFGRLYVVAMWRAVIPLLLKVAIRFAMRSLRALSMSGPIYTREVELRIYTRREGRLMIHSWFIEASKTMLLMLLMRMRMMRMLRMMRMMRYYWLRNTGLDQVLGINNRYSSVLRRY